jgi:hypothetical protein
MVGASQAVSGTVAGAPLVVGGRVAGLIQGWHPEHRSVSAER